MAYVKLPLLRQDSSFGFRKLNQLSDNLEAQKSIYAREHSLNDQFVSGGPVLPYWDKFGHHNTLLIARSVVRIDISVGALNIDEAEPVWGGGHFGVPEVVTDGSGDKHVFIPVAGLTTFYARAIPEQTSATPIRFCRCSSYYPPNPAYRGVFVTSLEHDGTSFMPTLMDFGLSLYGTR